MKQVVSSPARSSIHRQGRLDPIFSSLPVGNQDVGVSELKMLPSMHARGDGVAIFNVKVRFSLNADQSFHFPNQCSDFGDGFCNFNFEELYTRLISQL